MIPSTTVRDRLQTISDSTPLDLQRLRSFLCVAELEHVGRAARQLHISQSPLSRQIMQLESELGVTLFQREKKRLKLSAAGRALYEDARRLLDGEAALRRRARALAAGHEGKLRIGYVAGAVYAGVLPAHLARIRRATPQLRVELAPMTSAEQMAALESRAIDLGYAYRAPPRGGSLSSRLLHDEPFLIAVSKHVLGSGARPKLSELDAVPLITMPQASAPRGRAELMSALSSVGLDPEVQLEASDPAVLLALVDARMGFAVLQQSLKALAPRGVRFVPLPRRFPMRLQVHLLQLAAAPLPAALSV